MLLESFGIVPTPTPPVITGIAGWYGNSPRECRGCLTEGDRFITANGEVFDDSLPTVACGLGDSCSIFPVGTTVRITNLDNGEETTAKVTDTGGFAGLGRIADCSKAVAERLDFLDEGLALVRIEIIPATPAPNLLP